MFAHSGYVQVVLAVALPQKGALSVSSCTKATYSHLRVGRSALGKKLFLVSMFRASWTPPLCTKLNCKHRQTSSVLKLANPPTSFHTTHQHWQDTIPCPLVCLSVKSSDSHCTDISMPLLSVCFHTIGPLLVMGGNEIFNVCSGLNLKACCAHISTIHDESDVA